MAAATSSDPIPVLILGPSGTGKEKVARAIHENSKRSGGPFRAVNCGAISAELMESELFGHLKGAFSGAFRGKIGMWEAADKGTLFLDEIGDLLPEHQVKILRALQEKKIRPVGATEELSVDVRIITATNRDLFFMVKEGQFRDDLYYRLRGVLIRTPAIRDTPEEIPAMADTFWKVITKDSNAALSDSIKQQLKSYPWPGNIRHLKSVLRQLHALFPRKTIEPRHLNYIMTMDDPTHCVAKPRSEDNNVKPQLTKCLRHLRRVDEAVNATMAMIGPCLKSKRMDREKLAYIKKEIRYHIEEMELLFNDPLLFGTHETFTSVYHLKGKLTFFNSLLAQGYGPAQEYWQKEVKEDFSHVLTNIFKAFETVQDQA
jgi:transcriptional regulator with PAS, ATPase and Fis domain